MTSCIFGTIGTVCCFFTNLTRCSIWNAGWNIKANQTEIDVHFCVYSFSCLAKTSETPQIQTGSPSFMHMYQHLTYRTRLRGSRVGRSQLWRLTISLEQKFEFQVGRMQDWCDVGVGANIKGLLRDMVYNTNHSQRKYNLYSLLIKWTYWISDYEITVWSVYYPCIDKLNYVHTNQSHQ